MGDSTGTYTFCALVCAPVPVGHRVEVSWLDQKGGGFFGTPSKRLAHVVDLDTGVTYGEMECFDLVGAMRTEPRPLGLATRSDLTVGEHVQGRVLACQVATMGFTDRFIQTTLVVEVAPPESPPFR